MKLIGKRFWQKPQFGVIHMNCGKEDSTGGLLSLYTSREAVEAFGLTVEQARKIPVLAGGIVGLSSDHPIGRAAMEVWLDAAHKEVGFFSPRSEQSALSMVAYLLQMSQWEDIHTLAWNKETLTESTRFYIDYDAVTLQSGIWGRFLSFWKNLF